MFTFTNFLLIGVGAAMGAWLRWFITYALYMLYPAIPLGTVSVNLLGGFLMGLSLAAFQNSSIIYNEEIRLLLNVGFLGSLTTFSAYSADILSFLQKGQISMAIILIFSNVLGALLFAYIGWFIFNFLVD
jgi:CrcB protein